MKARSFIGVCTILCGLVAALVAAAAVQADVGHRDGAYAGGTHGSPTTSKPESKLWFKDGRWWAVMAKKVTPTDNEYHIFRLNPRRQRWIDTGVLVDSRDSTRQDVLATGNKLFIASHKYVTVAHDTTLDPSDTMRLRGFTYHAASHTYTLDGEWQIDTEKSETLVIDRDSTGAIWATWVQESGGSHHVYVKKTDGNCVANPAQCTFTGPTVTVADVSGDDISSVVRFGGNKVGVMWSDTRDTTNDQMLFAVHQDGDPVTAWTPDSAPAVAGPKMADDHINLKTDSAGRVYAATKTKFRGATKPGTMILRRSLNGTWKHFTVTRASFSHTRPIVLIDEKHNRIRVFEGSTRNTAIFTKAARLNRLSFPEQRAGARVIKDAGSEMANPTSTKQRVTMTRLVVLATNPETKRYWHAYLRTKPRHR